MQAPKKCREGIGIHLVDVGPQGTDTLRQIVRKSKREENKEAILSNLLQI
jgi:hypothetical protein